MINHMIDRHENQLDDERNNDYVNQHCQWLIVKLLINLMISIIVDIVDDRSVICASSAQLNDDDDNDDDGNGDDDPKCSEVSWTVWSRAG